MGWEKLQSYRWWSGGFILLLAAFITGFFVFNRPIKQVKIIGRFHAMTPECIYSVLGPHINGRYWPTHQAQLFKDAKSQCPWLYQWQWHHHWPATLVIHLEENHPQLVFNKRSLMNQSNQLFSPKQLPKTLPAISFEGPPDSFSDMLGFYKQALPLLQTQNYSIKQLQLAPSNDYMLTLNNGIILKLSQQGALQTLSRFLSVDQNLFGKPHKPIQSIDLRYPHGFAVQWKG
jgi:cell division protein FtsQ